MFKKLGLVLVILLATVGVAFATTYENVDMQTQFRVIGAPRGITTMTSTATAISTSYRFVYKTMATAGQVGTLANGVMGQLLIISAASVATSGTFVITPTTKTGFATVTLAAQYDSVTLLYVDDTYGWVIVGVRGATVA